MKPVPMMLIALAVAAAAVALIGVKRMQDARSEAAPSELVANRPSIMRDEVDAAGVARPPVPESPAHDVRTGEDYGVLIDELRPLAEAGDAKAQYDIYKATAYCQDRVRFYFTLRGRRLSLGEGLEWAVKRRVSYDTAQAVYKKCRSFIETDPKNDGQSGLVDWLNASAKQGYAPAQAALATKLLERQLLQRDETEAGVASSAPTEPLDRTKSPIELLSEAVKSGDPEVLFTISDMLPLIRSTDTDDDYERFAWMTLACERGFDCSAQAEWVVGSCLAAECQSINSPTELVRILVGDRWPEVQARARELGASLDAGRWDELGLDSSAP